MMQVTHILTHFGSKRATFVVAATVELKNDFEEIVKYIVDQLFHESTKFKKPVENLDSPSRLPKEMSGLLSWSFLRQQN